MEEIGIHIEIENYRIYRADTYNILLQCRKVKANSNEFYWVTEGYYTTEQQALIALFRKISKSKYKGDLRDMINCIREVEASLIQAIKGLKL